MNPINRRQALATLATTGAALALKPNLIARETEPRRTSLGLVTYAFGIHQKNHWNGRHAGLSPALALLEEARDLNTAGIQVDLGPENSSDATELRRRAESYGMYVEASISPPKTAEDVDRFEKSVLVAKAAGATLARTVILPGRRYEDFKSLEQFRKAEEHGLKSLLWAEPILARHQLRLAVENHKDQRVSEKLTTIKSLNSEFIGLCLDVGNSFTLMEDPIEVVRAYAPYAFTVHFKDQAVRETVGGFEFADVKLGEGFLDLPQIVSVVRKAKPGIHFNLELITRDALQVPILQNEFWQTMPETSASQLAHVMAIIKQHNAPKPFIVVSKLPIKRQLVLEADNVRRSLAYARDHLGFS